MEVFLKCTFQSNILINATSTGSLFGGSAVYLNSPLSIVKRCIFIKNEGESSFKIDSEFDKVASRVIKENGYKSGIEIDDCEFDIHSSSKSSISYVHGSKSSVDTVVSNCVFTGKILNGAHHIKVDNKSCKFACDKVKSINLNVNELSNSLIVFNLKNQVFNYNEKMYNKSNTKKLFVTAISLASIVVITLVSVIIKIKKHDDDGENDDINDPLNQPLDANNIL